MAKILSVDDSRAIRAMISKEVRALGVDVDEAEDGEQGLARVEECNYDLILLDVTMPVLDGPGMLAKLREMGNKTPVVMLTSESKKGIVSTVMKLGIDDYILKPFKPDELAAKVKKVLKLGAGGPSASAVVSGAQAPVAASAAPAPAAAAPVQGDSATTGRQFVDLMVIDDMENVAKKLRGMIPQHMSLGSATNGFAAIAACRERVYRVVLIDFDIPDVNCAALVGQLRSLQPHAAFLSLALKTMKNAEEDARKQGFDGVVYKPFDPSAIEDFLLQYFDNQDLVTLEDNVIKLGRFAGRDDRLDRYFQRARKLCEDSVGKLAAACFEDAIVDLTHLPPRMDRVPSLVLSIIKNSQDMGLAVKLVAPAEIKSILASFADTNSVPCYSALSEAVA